MGSAVSAPGAPPLEVPDAPTPPTSPPQSPKPKPKRGYSLTIESSASESDTPSRGKHLKNKPFSDSPDGRYSRSSPVGIINSLERSQGNPSQRLHFEEIQNSINQVDQSAQSPAALEPPSQPDEEVFNASAGVGTDATLDEHQPPSPPQPPLDKNHWILQTIFGPIVG